jgi:hypothetical protein
MRRMGRIGSWHISLTSAGSRTTGTRRILCTSPRCLLRPGSSDPDCEYRCGAVTNEHNKFIYNGAGFFLTMAIADKAIWGFESLRELQEQKIPPGQNELKLRYRESAADRPIIRKCTKANGVTEEPMPKSAFTAIFNKTLQNAGYLCSTSVHAIRREIGKKVDGKIAELVTYLMRWVSLC